MGLIDSYPERYLPRDPISNNFLILEPEHGAVHDGVHFTAVHQETVGTGTAVTVLFTTPSAPTYIHFIGDVQADKGVTWTFSEAPVSTGGSVLASYNNNRNSSNASPLVGLKYGATVAAASVGTILERGVVGTGGNPSQTVGGGGEHRNEWLLKPEESYCFRVSAAAATTTVTIRIPYYYRG
jgi:hypothetical protein